MCKDAQLQVEEWPSNPPGQPPCVRAIVSSPVAMDDNEEDGTDPALFEDMCGDDKIV